MLPEIESICEVEIPEVKTAPIQKKVSAKSKKIKKKSKKI
jgi:hypothetical protein